MCPRLRGLCFIAWLLSFLLFFPFVSHSSLPFLYSTGASVWSRCAVRVEKEMEMETENTMRCTKERSMSSSGRLCIAVALSQLFCCFCCSYALCVVASPPPNPVTVTLHTHSATLLTRKYLNPKTHLHKKRHVKKSDNAYTNIKYK